MYKSQATKIVQAYHLGRRSTATHQAYSPPLQELVNKSLKIHKKQNNNGELLVRHCLGAAWCRPLQTAPRSAAAEIVN